MLCTFTNIFTPLEMTGIAVFFNFKSTVQCKVLQNLWNIKINEHTKIHKSNKHVHIVAQHMHIIHRYTHSIYSMAMTYTCDTLFKAYRCTVLFYHTTCHTVYSSRAGTCM